jgi:hypothetical protein
MGVNMSSKLSKQTDTKDQLTKSIESNSCVMCRAARKPVCTCKRGSSAKRSASEAQLETETSALLTSPLEIQLSQSTGWKRSDESAVAFTYENRYAFFTPHLDLEKGQIVFHGIPRLIRPRQTLLDEFFQEIVDEFKAFKDELEKRGISVENMNISIKDNKLTISIPNPQYYQAFIQRLVDKKLLSMQAAQEKQLERTPAKQHNQKYSSPTPFSLNPRHG